MPHKSSKDPSDLKECITVGFYTLIGTRPCSGHAHADNSYKLVLSRSGRQSKGSAAEVSSAAMHDPEGIESTKQQDQERVESTK